MNICIVSQRYPYKDNMEFVFVKKLVDEWAKMGHHCTVITNFPIQVYMRRHIRYKPRYYKDEVAPGVYVNVYNPRTFSIPGIGLLNHLWGILEPQKAFDRHMKKLDIKFDFIYCHFFQPSVNAFVYAKRNEIPFFIATGESEIPPMIIPYNSFTLNDYKDYTSGVVAVSTKNKIESSNLGLADVSKCKIFPNGTNLAVFNRKDRKECRQNLGLPLDSFIVICVGYFSSRKGQERVLAAINKLNNPSIKAIFIGELAAIDGTDVDGENVLFKGSVPNTLIPDYLNASDVFCLPTQFEGCCNAVIEAMACGCAIISSDKSFNYDVLNHDNAILINPDNIDEIKNAIITLYNDADLRKKYSERAYEDSRRLSINQRAEGIMNFIVERLENAKM